MMRGLILAIMCGLASGLAAPTQAQLLVEPSDAMVKEVAHVVRANLSHGRYPDGSSVAPETSEELASPIIPFALEQQTIRRGLLTGELQVCGADWQRVSFEPYMQRIRKEGRLSPKQLVYVGMLHGFAQGQIYTALRTRVKGCSEQRVTTLEKMAQSPLALP